MTSGAAADTLQEQKYWDSPVFSGIELGRLLPIKGSLNASAYQVETVLAAKEWQFQNIFECVKIPVDVVVKNPSTLFSI